MSDLSNILATYIRGLDKPNFDYFIKTVINTRWHISDVSIIDGTNDGGTDVRIFENKRRKKTPIQLTVQKKPYSKLEEDLEKIDKLITEYDYLPELHFFCTESISESKVRELEAFSFNNYNIELKIYDSKVLGTYANEEPKLKSIIKEILGDFDAPTDLLDDVDRLKYDLLNYSLDSKAIKQTIIEAFILNLLYKQNNRNKNEISELICVEYNIDNDGKFCTRLINRLYQQKKSHTAKTTSV